jgi:hypothetical protein
MGTRCSQRPRQMSAAAARKTSRMRYNSPRQRRSAQALAEMGDRLLDQRAQPSLQAVERPLGVAEAVLGAAVADRCVPVLTHLGQPAESPIQQAGDPDIVEDPCSPASSMSSLLVAAARPATVAPQQVAVDGRDGKALGAVSVPLGVVHDLLVGPAGGSLHPGGQPVYHDRLAGLGHLRKPVAQVIEAGDEAPVGLAVPQRGKRTKQQVHAVANLGLGDPDRGWRVGTTARPGGPRRRRPGAPPATAAGCRPGQTDALGAGGPGDRPARPVRLRAARSGGSMTRGAELSFCQRESRC